MSDDAIEDTNDGYTRPVEIGTLDDRTADDAALWSAFLHALFGEGGP